jgi:endoglucanase
MSFKEFDVAFGPDHAADRVLAEMNGGTVNLTFHFWSGELVTYIPTRSGGVVTGTAG